MSDLSLVSCEHLHVLLRELVRRRMEADDPVGRDEAGRRLLDVVAELDARASVRWADRDRSRRAGAVPSPARGVPRLVRASAAGAPPSGR
ncbi:hypothetical protein [Cellulomonas marina]|uniref:Uncharacterized protein n=1 Tax=Cellulomonas marina TaxID=988821 RepID=A0A1I1ADV6_9CELL|nr:hypothetical protein [Cellulomonas marina]GIG29698.1 hypothetical protein Cma02nite_22980 [Cellulomonas marina]SFB36185.1 hypothetical protein SAMN05421867_11755 [Cellulomonas marina]